MKLKVDLSRPRRLFAGVLIGAMGGLASVGAVCAATVQAQDFSRLVELSAKRLDISRQVALTKWDSKLSVADPPNDPREKQVIDAATSEARDKGLPGELASAFFADQIEASKLVQFVLMADWRRSGSVPADRRADLKTELRPALDRLRTQFIEELVATQTLRADPACKLQLARAAGEHGERHRLAPLYRIGLDRGLARVCGD
ncbi:chorismate mutase [Variovorax sp. J22P271]|uniref:chorismate mutase n=1 Tax=Variovorax davisae TaxID=3053515 RepID=UPI002575F970|nr:chorismate mutase [Variovorax sp. J22P271]MDM0032869.1 chorismate mutase [Variovorax sp. J22P271]